MTVWVTRIGGSVRDAYERRSGGFRGRVLTRSEILCTLMSSFIINNLQRKNLQFWFDVENIFYYRELEIRTFTVSAYLWTNRNVHKNLDNNHQESGHLVCFTFKMLDDRMTFIKDLFIYPKGNEKRVRL